MTRFLLVTLLLLHGSLFSVPTQSPPAKTLTINLIVKHFHGKGLEVDQQVLAEAIEKLGHKVNKISSEDAQRIQADVNIFFQWVVSDKLHWAKLNWFIPNPEWYVENVNLLNKIDLILCRTHETERIFQSLNRPTYYLGFTSIDCYQPHIQKDYSHFLHLAGASYLKGTAPIQQIWLSHPLFPLLTVVRYPSDFISPQANLQWIPYQLPTDQVRLLQNQCGVHLCPSETEGFGHYLMEAMSAGAVVLTTQAPPMNEFIHDPRCLIPCLNSTPMNLGTCYRVDPMQLEQKVLNLLGLPPTELTAIGLNNRAIYLEKKQEFYEKLEELLWLFSSALN